MSDQTTTFVGSIPERYDRGLGPIFFADFADEMARRVAVLSPTRVLETSAGTGIVSRRLRDRLPAEASLVVTDLNPPMLEVARTKFRPGERVEFQPADATVLPFPDAAFDVVVCQFGVMFFPDKQRSFGEAYRVLMPGGRYLFSVWDAHRFNPAALRTHELLGTLFPQNPPRFYEVPYSYYRIDTVKEAVTHAGFTDFTASVLRIDKTVPDPATFADGVIYGNPVIEQIRGRGGDPAAVVEALIALLHREFGDPVRIPLQIILFEVRKA